jgi:tRNA A-37 threonylcarbamoyl transferase component Bud32
MPGTIRPPSSADLLAGMPSSPDIRMPTGSSPGLSSGGGGLAPRVANAVTNMAGSSPHVPLSSLEEKRMQRVCPICGVRYPAEFKVCPRDASELADIAEREQDELVGTTLSQTYSIVRVIGEGGMGRVYEARHTRMATKRFAIKMLHPEFARQPEVISRFQREAEAVAAIQSPYVVGVYDVDRTGDGRPFMVGEFLEGAELGALIADSGRMPVGQAVRVVRQICKALGSAHTQGVIHRDMKPENVFLTGDMAHPVAKVIDFGISKIGDSPGTALTKTGMIMGTPSYMAPEQARGEHVDHRADIYAVGAILYAAVTGKRPFDRGDPTATLMAVLTEDPARPRSIDPTIPEPLELVIQRAMAKSPADRYQSMDELDADLAPFDADTTALVHDPRGAGGRRQGTALDRQTREVGMARPLIALMTALGVFWIFGSVITTITASVRLSRGGGPTANLTSSESIMLVVGIVAAMVTPLVLLVRHVTRNVWDNSLRSLELADKLRRPVAVGLAAYGFGSLLVRVIEAVVLRRAVGVAWPVWDLLLFGIGLVAALGAVWVTGSERRR